ncbi:hypothetical protein VNO77_27683 [Canavalia gladiata]|uniref:Uncharacterized protein n=1 Tax=Canavalia gladiata TaxID=3824 RepID=A0AAN9KUK7_CANGL
MWEGSTRPENLATVRHLVLHMHAIIGGYGHLLECKLRLWDYFCTYQDPANPKHYLDFLSQIKAKSIQCQNRRKTSVTYEDRSIKVLNEFDGLVLQQDDLYMLFIFLVCWIRAPWD